jgi:tetratricopeptide (TPR) repeat protein
MAEWHMSADLFRRFLNRTAPARETKRLIRHLLHGCEACQTLASRIIAESGYWFPKRGFASQAAYEDAFESALRFADAAERRAAVSRLRGWGQWAALESLLPEERLALVMAERKFHHWGFFHALLDAGRWYAFSDPREAVLIAELAITVCELLDAAMAGGEEAAADLQARAHAFLGNARRLASDLPGAREAINEAWCLHAEGTGDPLEKAHLLSLDASYIRTIGEFETAETTLEEALRIYTTAGDLHLQGRTLLKMGDAIGYVNPERGIAHIRRALALINTSRESRLEICGQHDLARLLTDAGRPDEALAIVNRARPLYKQFPDSWLQLRLHWLEGKIARGLGHLEEAEHIFRQLFAEFRERELHEELVFVALDLAETYVAEGQYASAARLVREVYPALCQWNLHRNALAAWLMLQNALELQEVDDMLGRIRLYLLRHWNRPAEFGG